MKIAQLGYRLVNGVDPKLLENLKNKVREWSFADPRLAAKFFAYKARSSSFILPKETTHPDTHADFPTPPEELWYGYANTPEEYLTNGRTRVEQARQILESTGFKMSPGHRILDFGCGS